MPAASAARKGTARTARMLYAVDWRSGGLQSDWRGFACGQWGFGDRYFVVDASRKGDSSVGARIIVLLRPPLIQCSSDSLPILLGAVRATSSSPERRWHLAWE